MNSTCFLCNSLKYFCKKQLKQFHIGVYRFFSICLSVSNKKLSSTICWLDWRNFVLWTTKQVTTNLRREFLTNQWTASKWLQWYCKNILVIILLIFKSRLCFYWKIAQKVYYDVSNDLKINPIFGSNGTLMHHNIMTV